MASHVVLEPPDAPLGERTRVIPDRFAFLALIAPLIWLLWHRLWLEALLLLAASFALGALSAVPGYEGLAIALGLLLALLIALEGGALRIAALRRRGWREVAVIEAAGREDAELRYVAGLGSLDRPAGPVTPPLGARPIESEMLGMIDYPGTR